MGIRDAATITRAEHDAAVAERDAKIAEDAAKIARLEERVAKLQHALWGRRSEKQSVSPDSPFQSALFGEERVDLPPDEDDSPESTEQQESTTSRKKPRRKSRFREEVERQVIDIELPEPERKCSCCGETMASIGYESAERAHHVPAKIVIHEERRHKYACKCKEGGVTTTPVPPTLFPKTRVTDETRVHAIVSKYVDHCPYYRQSAILRRLGYEISDATLGRLAIEAADRLAPIIIAMHEELLASSVLQADETTLPVLKTEKQKPGAHRGWLWAYGIPRGTIVFDYTRTRAQNHPLGFLEGYSGILQVDRYEEVQPGPAPRGRDRRRVLGARAKTFHRCRADERAESEADHRDDRKAVRDREACAGVGDPAG